NTCPNESCELLIEQQEVVGFDPGVGAPATQTRQGGNATCLGWSNVEDTKALAFQTGARFTNTGRFDCSGYDLACRRSESTNELSHKNSKGESITRASRATSEYTPVIDGSCIG